MAIRSNFSRFVKRAHSCRGPTWRESSIEVPDTLWGVLVVVVVKLELDGNFKSGRTSREEGQKARYKRSHQL